MPDRQSLWGRFGGLFGRKANEDGSARNSLDLFRLLYGWMATKSGMSVSHLSALEVPVFLACARVIAEGLAQVPLKVYRQTGESKKPAIDHPLYEILHSRPNDWMSSYDLRETMGLHAFVTGNAVCFVNRVTLGEIAELIPLLPQYVSWEQKDDFSIVYKVSGPKGGVKEFPQSAIWHVRGSSWNGVGGMDLVRLSREAIGLSMATEQQHARIVANGMNTTGVFSVNDKLAPDQYKQLRQHIDEVYGGVENAGKAVILDRGGKYYPRTLSMVDAQAIETRRFQIEEVCRGARVMPIMVGHSDKATTYASAEQMFLAHAVHTMGPWYTRFEQSMYCQLLTERDRKEGLFARFNAAGLMRGSHKDRSDYFAKALGAGGSPAWMTQDEVRELDELNPMGGDAAVLPKPTNVAPKPSASKDDSSEEV